MSTSTTFYSQGNEDPERLRTPSDRAPPQVYPTPAPHRPVIESCPFQRSGCRKAAGFPDSGVTGRAACFGTCRRTIRTGTPAAVRTAGRLSYASGNRVREHAFLECSSQGLRLVFWGAYYSRVMGGPEANKGIVRLQGRWATFSVRGHSK